MVAVYRIGGHQGGMTPDWDDTRPVSLRTPRDDCERELVAIWQEVLKHPKIELDDDFFELGGTSLQALMVFAEIEARFGCSLSPTAIVQAPTIARLAEFIRAATDIAASQSLVPLRASGTGLPLFLVHNRYCFVMYYRHLLRDLKSNRPVFGLQPPPLNGKHRIARTVETMAADYVTEIRRVQPHGPYLLAGHSYGGLVSFEIAQQLNWEVPDFVVVPGGNLGNVSAIANGFLLMKQMGLVDRIPRLVCAQTELANPFYRAYVNGFDRLDSMTAGNTLATAIRIGDPVSFPKAVRAMQLTNGIVEQVTEAALANAAGLVDRFGFFNDPQTGVALAATAKLIGSGTIPKVSKVVVISTAHGLKFVDFKLRFHRNELAGTSAALTNLPIEVPSNSDAIRDVIDGKIPARVRG